MGLAGTALGGSILITGTQPHPPSSVGPGGICSCKLNTCHHTDVRLSINTMSNKVDTGITSANTPGQQGSRTGTCTSLQLPTQPRKLDVEWWLWQQMGARNGTPESCPAAESGPAALCWLLSGFTRDAGDPGGSIKCCGHGLSACSGTDGPEASPSSGHCQQHRATAWGREWWGREWWDRGGCCRCLHSPSLPPTAEPWRVSMELLVEASQGLVPPALGRADEG